MTARTIISATEPRRFVDSYTEILLKVWFEELGEPVGFLATPFDCERHGKELWIRAMAGEFGEIEVIDMDIEPMLGRMIEMSKPPLLLEHEASHAS